MIRNLPAAFLATAVLISGGASAQTSSNNLIGNVLDEAGTLVGDLLGGGSGHSHSPPPSSHQHTAPAPFLAAGLPSFAALGGLGLIGRMVRRKKQKPAAGQGLAASSARPEPPGTLT